jgi:DNA segregation ATPase FtsK/SpoIIIE, S-DNA-T family
MSEFWEKLKTRRKIMKAFKSGELYLGTIERPIFPKIRKVSIQSHSSTVAFSLPRGLDPKEIKKKEYIFKQVFGTNIEVEGDVKEFKLTVWTSSLPSELKYDYARYTPLFEDIKLPIIAGMNMNGKITVYDMVNNPHLLISGETGSGKSTQLRSVLTALIQTLPPERLELYLCDLKRSEFHLFRHIEHVRGLFNSSREMEPMLKHLQKEMRRRGDILDQNEVSHVDDLSEPLPYIVLCIDEVALLQEEKKLMSLVEEISAIGRALGVFLILSMQRPDRKVLDGKLKNNLTVRMGFKCADLINSRIVGTPGSEKLKKSGRMLLKLPVYDELKEIQGPYLTIEGAKKILGIYKSIKGEKSKQTPYRPSGDVLETEEIQPNVFGVLDE